MNTLSLHSMLNAVWQRQSARLGLVGRIGALAAGVLFVALMTCLSNNAWAAQTIVRTQAFDYDPNTGVLKKEVIEPSNSTLCVVNEYTLDAYGRRQLTTTRNCAARAGSVPGALPEAPPPPAAAAFPARAASSAYSRTGTAEQRFVTATTNALGHTITWNHDARFGTVSYKRDANGLESNTSHDALGRKTREMGLAYPYGGLYGGLYGTVWGYEYCAGTDFGSLACPTVEGAAVAYVVTSRAATDEPQLNPTTGATSIVTVPYGLHTRKYFDALGREVRTETQSLDGNGAITLAFQDTKYNQRGLVEKRSHPYFSGQTPYWVSYEYDLLGRVTLEDRPTDAAPSGAVTRTDYAGGLAVTVTDPLGHVTTTKRDATGRVWQVIDAKNGVMTRSYDAVGNLVRTQDAKGNVVSMVYDAVGRSLLALYDPDLGVWGYCYDALGQLKAQQNTVLRGNNVLATCPSNTGTGTVAVALSGWSTFAYDVLGRMRQRIEPDATSTWTYDTYANPSAQPACNKGLGRLCEVTGANGYGRKINYDDLGRFITSTSTIDSAYTSSVSYDAFYGLPYELTYPTGLKIRRNYHLGILREVVDTRGSGTVLWAAQGWDAEQRLTRYTQGGVATTNDQYYPGTGRLNTSQTGAGGVVQNLVHNHDPAGRLTGRFDLRTAVSANYRYDELHRLTSEIRSGGGLTGSQTIGWTYDAIGNIKTRTEGGLVHTYNYNASGTGSLLPHAVASVSGSVSGVSLPIYAYDANGNLRSGAGRNIAVTGFDKVARIDKGNARLDYLYGAEHERVQERYYLGGALQRTTIYLNPGDGQGLFYEQESGVAGTKKRHYVDADGGTVAVIVCTADPCTNVANTTTQYWHRDHLGSISVVTNSAGAVVERMAYEPFGKRRRSDGTTDVNGTLAPSTDRGYTGHEHMDEVGLVNMNGRVYDPGLGRFVSADPRVTDPLDQQSFNRYSYVRNAPLSAVDPSGYDYEYIYTPSTPMYYDPTTSQLLRSPTPSLYTLTNAYFGSTGSRNIFASNEVFGGGILSSNSIFTSGPNGGGYDLPGAGAAKGAIGIEKEFQGLLRTQPDSAEGWTARGAALTDLSGRYQDLMQSAGLKPDVALLAAMGLQMSIAQYKLDGDSGSLALRAGAAAIVLGMESGGNRGPSGRISTEKFLEKRWDKATFGSVEKSIEYHVGKHGNGMSAVEYTQRAMSAFNDSSARRTTASDLLGRPAVRVQSEYGSGLFTNQGRIIWFQP
jgi:RHS repeat-associated protein